MKQKVRYYIFVKVDEMTAKEKKITANGKDVIVGETQFPRKCTPNFASLSARMSKQNIQFFYLSKKAHYLPASKPATRWCTLQAKYLD